jgi:histidine ammonia-lyase
MPPPIATSHAERRREKREIVIGAGRLTIEDVETLASGRAEAVLSDDPEFKVRIDASRRAFVEALSSGNAVYGVTTGVGASVANTVPEALRAEMAHNLYRFHGCGTGALLSEREAAAVVVLRLVTFAHGASAVRIELLDRLLDLLHHRVLPCIPEEGSVGASGDLTPLSYLAALVSGECEALVAGEVVGADVALTRAGLEPFELLSKESLSLMNGTAVMTAITALCVARIEALCEIACAVTGVVSDVTQGNPVHFDKRVVALKPHAGSVLAASWIRRVIERDGVCARVPARLQDRYSVRCAPQIIGVLLDALQSARTMIEVEINGVDDNPMVDLDSGEILHGGNFYGGHVCFAADSLKVAVAGLADLLDRQLVLLCTPETNAGLPENLVGIVGQAAVAHHGFKAMQITASALTAEALKMTTPAAAFSRSTESHNQDKVSMGTIAARDLRRVVDLTETVAAIAVLTAAQAADLRAAIDGDASLAPGVENFRNIVRAEVPRLVADRRQDLDIAAVKRMIADGLLDSSGSRGRR